jgi:hypothetical protein
VLSNAAYFLELPGEHRESMKQSTTDKLSRRQVVSRFGAGAFIAAASFLSQDNVPARATNMNPTDSSGPGLEDPTTKYPRPPYPEQLQPWPGLVSQMTPRPDHGESSYRGSGRLLGRRALITGGDSGMGRAAAIAYAREGADVAINYYPSEEPDAKEVIALIERAGRHPCLQRRSTADACVHSRHFNL